MDRAYFIVEQVIKRTCLALAFCAMCTGCTRPPAPAGEWEHSLSGLFAAAVSSNGGFAVVSSSTDGASFWDLRENKRLFDWRHNDSGDNPIASVAFAPDDSHVITADSRSFVIWNTQTGQALGYWGVDADINAVALSNGAKHVLLGLSDGRAIHIDQASQRRLEVVAHQGERVTSVALSADGAIAATGGDDRRVMVWRSRDGQQIHALQHVGRVGIVRLDRAQSRLFTADERDAARVWDLKSGQVVATLALGKRQHNVSAARFSDDGSSLLLGFPGRKVSLWSTTTGKRLQHWLAPNRRNGWIPQGSTVYAVAFDRKTNRIVAESSNGLGGSWSAAAQL